MSQFEIEVKNGVLYNGNFSVNLDAIPDMKKEEFIEKFKGKFDTDIETIWNNVEAHRSVMEIHNKQVDESTGKPGKKGSGNSGK